MKRTEGKDAGMYHDHVRRDRLTNKAWFLGVLALAITAAGIVGGIGHTGLAAAVAPVTAALPGGESLVTVWAALGLTLILTLNVHLLGRLSLRLQVAAVWLEVLSLFLAFFYSFDLSYSFIPGKLSFLITQGVATTLYISAISIGQVLPTEVEAEGSAELVLAGVEQEGDAVPAPGAAATGGIALLHRVVQLELVVGGGKGVEVVLHHVQELQVHGRVEADGLTVVDARQHGWPFARAARFAGVQSRSCGHAACNGHCRLFPIVVSRVSAMPPSTSLKVSTTWAPLHFMLTSVRVAPLAVACRSMLAVPTRACSSSCRVDGSTFRVASLPSCSVMPFR
ncbi:hypothetical protein F1643_16385 [Azospirillum sp. INR13]|uniref:hypothetical protein n=1 Tax=Azospirillum sp. INR13 TaxID=2596919 RepID=UPI00189249B0|nr:hypothetical protein [Azospirillum sp. INR13]MBF5095774.1 hypothetical protein [Azospirillum sp. INR13]